MKKRLDVVFDIMVNGKYQIEEFLNLDIKNEYKVVFVKNRKIYIPSEKFRRFQWFIANAIIRFFPINESVAFAYRKGSTVVDAVKPHSSSKFFYKTDFYGFFDSINRSVVESVFDKNIDKVKVDLSDDVIRKIIDMIVVDDRLPQGFVSSPMMSNACLKEFDDILQLHCIDQGLVYSRYSDDLIISGLNEEVVKSAEAIIVECANELNLPLVVNKEKTKFIRTGGRVSFLGISILPNGQLAVPAEIKEKIELLLHFFIKDKKSLLGYSGKNLKDTVSQVSGYINHINSVDKAYLLKLRKKYGSTIIDMFLHKTGDAS